MFNGELVKRLRLERQLSILDVAQHTGISRSYLTLIEAGKRQPKLEFQEKIAQFFDLPLDSFLDTGIVESFSLVGATDELNRSNALEGDSSGPQLAFAPCTELTLQDYLVFGMVQSILLRIRHSFLESSSPHFDLQFAGKMVLSNSHENTSLLPDFHLKATQEYVSLLLMAVPTSVEIALVPYCIPPDVVILNSHFETGSVSNKDLVWFTEYVSLIEQARYCDKWTMEDQSLEIRKEDLLSLFNLIKPI